MIEISTGYIHSNLVVYSTVILILFLGMKLHVSWIDIHEKITRKKFLKRWIICLFLDITIYLIIIFSKIFESHNILVYDLMTNFEAVLIIVYEVLAISSIIQRCHSMIHSKIFMIGIMLIWTLNDFLKLIANPILLLTILVISMLPDKNNLKEELPK